MSHDELEPFINLRDRLREAVEPLGLTVPPHGFTVVPGEDRLAPHHAHVLFEISDDALKTPEQLETDKAFEEMMVLERDAERQQKKAAARQQMLEHLKRGDILGTDDEPGEEGVSPTP